MSRSLQPRVSYLFILCVEPLLHPPWSLTLFPGMFIFLLLLPHRMQRSLLAAARAPDAGASRQARRVAKHSTVQHASAHTRVLFIRFHTCSLSLFLFFFFFSLSLLLSFSLSLFSSFSLFLSFFRSLSLSPSLTRSLTHSLTHSSTTPPSPSPSLSLALSHSLSVEKEK